MAPKKVALITGAAGDIGSNVAEHLYALGYELVLVDVNKESLTRLCESLPGSTAITTDQNNRESLEYLLSLITQDFGHINVAFINAGVISVGNVLDIDPKLIDLQLEVNLRSAIHLIRSCAENMVKHGSGHIISTVSMGGIISLKGSATYSASKFGLRGFMSALRDEVKPLGVDITGIFPSGVDTQMLRYEAQNGGSNLNFVSTPLAVKKVSNAVVKALQSKRLEIYLPYSDSIGGRIVSCFPWMIRYLYPLMEWLGGKGLKKYLKTIQN